MVNVMIKRAGLSLLWLVMLPIFILYWANVISFCTISQAISLVPGLPGIAIRRVWYEQTLEKCGENLVVDFLSAIRTPKTRIGGDCYIGRANWIGWADIGDYFLSGNNVTIHSGNEQHSYREVDKPIKFQEIKLRMVTIGKDVWTGSHSSILTDVSAGTVVGSGSVVTKTFPEYSVIAGVPAKILRRRK
jgi:acetyltransferase-like isoleucine patch superfamily enzyme